MKVFSAVLLVCLVGTSFALLTHEEEWKQFRSRFQKVYRTDEEHRMRFKVFVDNLIKIRQHNKEYEEGLHTYTKGVNAFTDMLHSEFVENMLMQMPPQYEEEDTMISEEELKELKSQVTAAELDWRSKGAVTPIKDQGQCGSCWSFSTTGTLEGAHFLATGQLVSLSEQQLVDCARRYNCYGCSGGWPAKALDYIRDNGGVETENAYSYEARDSSCRYNPSYVGATVRGKVTLPAADETALKNAVATKGPVSVLVDASGFSGYSGGILYTNSCSPNNLNHAVLAVGYGSEGGMDYWIIKNSWGTWWGENGYVRVARGYNMCGIASSNVYPTV